MKKILYFAVAALAFVACAKEVAPELTPEEKIENNTPKVKVSIKAVLAQEPETKATIDMSDGSGSWEKDDEIAVHTHNGSLAILKAESAGTSVVFSGEITAGDKIDENAVAYYPASIALAGASNVNKVNLPVSYESAAASAKGFLLRGVLAGEEIEFKHIGALLKVSVNDVPSTVTALEFSTEVAVTGQLAVNTTVAAEPKAVVGEGATTISISSAADQRTDPVTIFYIPLPTGTLTDGFSIVFKAGESTLYTKTTTNNVDISRAKVVKMKAFALEGAASDWRVFGGFNNWTAATGPQMTTVVGHEDWVVARNVDITPASGQNAGFKFVYETTYVGGTMSALHTQYQGSSDGNASAISYTNGKYDLYFNPTDYKFFLANAGEPWVYRTIYMMSDMNLSADKTYYLHVWNKDYVDSKNSWPGNVGSKETISGITYYKFPICINDVDMTNGYYNCIFHTSDDAIRYDFRQGKLHTEASISDYYLSFTGGNYNTAESGYTYGDSHSNPMTQFAGPSQPEGASNWHALFYSDYSNYSSSLVYKQMAWDNGPVLVYKDVLVNSSTGITFRFTNGHCNIFYYHDGPVTLGEDFAVVLNLKMSRSNAPMTTVVLDSKTSPMTPLDGEYLCDVYLDVINNTAKIVPLAKTDETTVSLYFHLTDRVPSQAKLYAWQGGNDPSWKNADWPGVNMTYVKDGNIDYYKAEVLATKVWGSSTKLIVDDVANDTVVWQTEDYENADWSGRKGAYYFSVTGNAITQLSGKPDAIAVSIDGVFSDWANSSIPSKSYSGILANLKAFSDGNKLFIYQKYDGSKVSLTNYDNYTQLLFDIDNNNSTGACPWYTSNSGGLDRDLEFRYYQSGDVRGTFEKIYFKSYINSSWSDTTFDDTKVNWRAAIDESNNVEVEMSIPIGQLGISKNSIIRIAFVARTPESTTSGESNMLTVRIPNTE